MVVKVKGIQAARIAVEIMERHTGQETGIHRGEDTGGVYWVSNTYLPPEGEQEVLDRLPRGTLLYCAGCSHQKPKQAAPPIQKGHGLSDHSKNQLLKLAREIRLHNLRNRV